MNARHNGLAKLWLLNIVGNAALLAGVYFWFVTPDAHGWQVAASALLAVAVIFCVLWLRAGSFAYFRLAMFRETGALWLAFRNALRHIIGLLLCFVPLAAIEWALFSLRQYSPQFGVWWWQKVPALRFGSPRAVWHAADLLLWIIMFVVLAVWLPLMSTVAAVGFSGSRIGHSLRVLRRPAYWLWLIVLIFIGLYLPYRLVWWVPEVSTLSKQAWSAGVRFAVAYLLLVSAFVAILLEVGLRAEKEDPQAANGPKPSAT